MNLLGNGNRTDTNERPGTLYEIRSSTLLVPTWPHPNPVNVTTHHCPLSLSDNGQKMWVMNIGCSKTCQTQSICHFGEGTLPMYLSFEEQKALGTLFNTKPDLLNDLEDRDKTVLERVWNRLEIHLKGSAWRNKKNGDSH